MALLRPKKEKILGQLHPRRPQGQSVGSGEKAGRARKCPPKDDLNEGNVCGHCGEALTILSDLIVLIV